MTRREILADFEARGVIVDEGVAYRTDDQIERLHRFWVARGLPSNVSVGIDAAKSLRSHGASIAEMFAEECLFWIRVKRSTITVGELDVTKFF